jgi:hypothetical protein
MAKKSYLYKLKDPRWQKKRLEILNIHNFTCEECGSTEKELHVHHRFYIKGREPWEYDNDVFQVLCNSCHEKEHFKKNKQKEIIPEKYSNVIKYFDLSCNINSDNKGLITQILIEYCSNRFYPELFEDINIIITDDSCMFLFLSLIKNISSQIRNEYELSERINKIERLLNI